MQSSGLIILVAGLLVIYLAITGRYKCFADFIACIGGKGCECSDASKSAAKVISPLTPLQPVFPQ